MWTSYIVATGTFAHLGEIVEVPRLNAVVEQDRALTVNAKRLSTYGNQDLHGNYGVCVSVESAMTEVFIHTSTGSRNSYRTLWWKGWRKSKRGQNAKTWEKIRILKESYAMIVLEY